MTDAALKQWTDTLEVISRARETGTLLPRYASRALACRTGTKESVLRDINAIRDAILALEQRCDECRVETDVLAERGRGAHARAVCTDCAINEDASAADRAYDAWKDGES